MPKKGTGYTPTGKGKRSPVEKEITPMKTPGIKPQSLPSPIKGTNAIASMPNDYRFPKLTRPAAMTPKAPRI